MGHRLEDGGDEEAQIETAKSPGRDRHNTPSCSQVAAETGQATGFPTDKPRGLDQTSVSEHEPTPAGVKRRRLPETPVPEQEE